jgi:PAS domain S-box-containing protein
VSNSAKLRGALLDWLHSEGQADVSIRDTGAEFVAWNRLLDQVRGRHDERLVCEIDAALSPKAGGAGLGSIADQLWIGLLVVDADNRVAYANGAAAPLLGQAEAAETLGQTLSDLTDRQEVLDLVSRALANRTSRASVEVESPVGDRRAVLRYTTRTMRGGERARALVVVEDVTQQRVAEEARHSFVATVAHELRTPLTNIQLNTEAALEDDADAAMRGACLNVINQEALRLTQIIEGMLSVAEVEAGQMQLHRDDVRLAEVAADLEAHYQQLAAEKRLDLRFEIAPKLPVITGDREKLLAAMHNLLGNAIKYTPEGGTVTVSIEHAGDRFTFDVTDTGPGIGPDDQDKVFQKFYRTDAARLDGIAGSGLGLALARTVARGHGGDVTLQSTLGQGSSFTLSLPVQSQ